MCDINMTASCAQRCHGQVENFLRSESNFLGEIRRQFESCFSGKALESRGNFDSHKLIACLSPTPSLTTEIVFICANTFFFTKHSNDEQACGFAQKLNCTNFKIDFSSHKVGRVSDVNWASLFRFIDTKERKLFPFLSLECSLRTTTLHHSYAN